MPTFDEITMFISVGWWLIVSVLVIGMLVSLIILAMSSREAASVRRY